MIKVRARLILGMAGVVSWEPSCQGECVLNLISSRCARNAALAVLGALFLASGLPACAQDKGDPKRGHEIARKYCSPCHAIERGQHKSPVADAPPFPTFSSKWPLEDIEEALAEGIMVGHEGVQMPEFQLDPPAIADLIAYLRSIQDTPPAPPPGSAG